LEGLEISEVLYSELEFSLRVDSEYYRPSLIEYEKLVSSKSSGFLKNISNFLIGPFGSAFTVDNYVEDKTYRYIRGKDVKPLKLKDDDNVYMPAEDYHRLSKYALKENDILVSVVGTLGNACLVTQKDLPAIFSCKSTVLRPNKINSVYLLTYINTKYGRELLLRKERGAIQKGLNLGDLENLLIHIPSNQFQLKIESSFRKQLGLIRLSKDNYTQAKELLLQEIGLEDFESKESENYQEISLIDSFGSTSRLDAEYYQPKPLFLINQLKQRKYVQIKDLFNIKNGFPWKSSYFREVGEGEPFVRIRDCKPSYIDNNSLTTLDKEYANSLGTPKAKPNDIVIGMDGIKYFYASLIREPVYVNQRVCHLTPKSKKYTSELITMMINSVIGQTQLMREMTIAQTVGHITNVSVGNLIIPELDDEICQEISDKIELSHRLKKQSEALLALAKRGVELAIETDEETALNYMEKADL